MKHDAESNKDLFKVLLHLSHCADKCFQKKLSKENQIFSISNVICKNLMSGLDKSKLFSALYYIVHYLLSKKCFKESKIICSYLLPGKLVDIEDYGNTLKYYQLAYLWQSELMKELDLVMSKPIEERIISEELISFVKFQLKILKLCDEKSHHTFIAIETYTRKLASVPLKGAP